MSDELNRFWDNSLKPYRNVRGPFDESPQVPFLANLSTDTKATVSSYKHAFDMESLLSTQFSKESLEPMAFHPHNMHHVLNHFPELNPMDGSFLRSAFENIDVLPNTLTPQNLPSQHHYSPPTALSTMTGAALLGQTSPQLKGHNSPDVPQGLTGKQGICQVPDCGRRVRSKGFCKAHGGGRKCTLQGCNKSAQNGEFCIGHGGGKQCTHPGCPKAAQSHGLCKAHGGGARCKHPDCMKSSQGGGYCRAHGGGKRCQAENCTKGAQRGNFCATHGGFRNCQIDGCVRTDRGGGYCEVHRRDKLCTVNGCKKLSKNNGLCTVHLRRSDKDTKKQVKGLTTAVPGDYSLPGGMLVI
ncbi:hypothetical protein H310_01034 [Aphanomyces invadans]|uniref:WRKY19-like zinc finger domain-containing protein n=1 Tax=Aphanomyces invadans TaxID=157072 RepID=A0A024UQA8_9STRA|nr:hypothetical protein H310_01034 [Aphanomyces invadans]ETW08454.1 hypothetical protein H310_01034 [Aphanomyces invadans]|eukprot:XP_008862259.1 hypothetical protein H310_01034 [Aphanomyces invadans]